MPSPGVAVPCDQYKVGLPLGSGAGSSRTERVVIFMLGMCVFAPNKSRNADRGSKISQIGNRRAPSRKMYIAQMSPKDKSSLRCSRVLGSYFLLEQKEGKVQFGYFTHSREFFELNEGVRAGSRGQFLRHSRPRQSSITPNVGTSFISLMLWLHKTARCDA